jgi:hypothetical protein
MKVTKADLLEALAGVPDDFEIRILVPCRIMKDYVDVEKGITEIKTVASYARVKLQTEILDLGPR